MVIKQQSPIINIKLISGSTLVKSIIIILLGLGIFYVDDKDFFDYKLTIAIIMLISVLKCAYFIGVSYQKIIEVSIKNIAYHKFMSFMALNIFLIIISFTTDFFCLIQVDARSLKGFDPNFTLPEKIFECFYFSILNFSFFGYGDILPATIPAKIELMLETIISFLTVILVLSDFISLKESLAERIKKKD